MTRTTKLRLVTPSTCCTSSPVSGWPLGKLTVVDATNIRPEDRKPLVALAREFHCLPVAFVFDIPKGVCIERNRDPPDLMHT